MYCSVPENVAPFWAITQLSELATYWVLISDWLEICQILDYLNQFAVYFCSASATRFEAILDIPLVRNVAKWPDMEFTHDMRIVQSGRILAQSRSGWPQNEKKKRGFFFPDQIQYILARWAGWYDAKCTESDMKKNPTYYVPFWTNLTQFGCQIWHPYYNAHRLYTQIKGGWDSSFTFRIVSLLFIEPRIKWWASITRLS